MTAPTQLLECKSCGGYFPRYRMAVSRTIKETGKVYYRKICKNCAKAEQVKRRAAKRLAENTAAKKDRLPFTVNYDGYIPTSPTTMKRCRDCGCIYPATVCFPRIHNTITGMMGNSDTCISCTIAQVMCQNHTGQREAILVDTLFDSPLHLQAERPLNPAYEVLHLDKDGNEVAISPNRYKVNKSKVEVTRYVDVNPSVPTMITDTNPDNKTISVDNEDAVNTFDTLMEPLDPSSEQIDNMF